ncbi:MAG TPA: outer membrane protein assembly factor BamA [Holophagaceae bacterium]|nr:outer membrane protein assembly factor BamA [Holophagaceae bacterium]
MNRTLRPGRGALLAFLAALAPAALKAQDAEPITKVEVMGAIRQTPQTVAFRAGVKAGDDARNLDYSAIVQRLWDSGAFDDVKLELVPDGDGQKLLIRVVERPVVKEVDYRGGTEVGVSNLKDKIKDKGLTIKPEGVYDPEAARKVKDQIVDICQEKGFRTPEVTVKLEPMGPGVARLVFDIKEGGKTHIYDVQFTGNKVLSQGSLAKSMKKTRKHWALSIFTSHDLLVQKNLDEDLENVKKAYWRRGYKDVFVGEPTIVVKDFTTDKQKAKNQKLLALGKSAKYDLRATMTIPVIEGDQFFEGHFNVEGNHLYGTDFYRLKYAEQKRDNRSFLKKIFGIKPSLAEPTKPTPFDLDAVDAGIDKVKEAYSDRSYILFHAEKDLAVREEGGRKYVDTTLKADEGEPYTVRSIEFRGNTNTKDKVLRRSMLLSEGGPFSVSMFKDSMLRLSQLGFFDVKEQDPKVDLVPGKPQVDLTILGTESGVNEVLFQGGYGQLFGFSLGASFSTRNLGGGGETLSLSYTGGAFQRNLSVAYTEPYLLDLPYSLSTSFSNGSVDYDASRVGVENAYKQFSRSIGIGMGAYLSNWIRNKTWANFTTVSLGYSFRLIRIEGGRNYYFRNIDNEVTSSVTTGISYNTVDHPYKPTRGTQVAVSFEYGGWQFGGDRPFLRTTVDLSKYYTAAERNIFAAHLSYGYLRNLSDEALLPFELYRPGGENSIRGYQYGQVGSVLFDNLGQPVVVGGNKQLILNFEYQFKIADQFRTVLFYDAGNAWGPGTRIFDTKPVTYTLNGQTVTYKNPDLLKSFGVELRFFLPISPAPLRLIWSHKVNPYPFDPNGQNDFQFSIGTTF